mmetsp:Transcript_19477/g.35322  ORF Transcript_19477/g.35322 Transcript_19477/m.35322 type:complete len:433 (-) Transcript_19477:76-1374(-)
MYSGASGLHMERLRQTPLPREPLLNWRHSTDVSMARSEDLAGASFIDAPAMKALTSAVAREREAFEASHGAALAFSTRLGLAEAELLGRAEALRKVVLGNRSNMALESPKHQQRETELEARIAALATQLAVEREERLTMEHASSMLPQLSSKVAQLREELASSDAEASGLSQGLAQARRERASLEVTTERQSRDLAAALEQLRQAQLELDAEGKGEAQLHARIKELAGEVKEEHHELARTKDRHAQEFETVASHERQMEARMAALRQELHVAEEGKVRQADFERLQSLLEIATQEEDKARIVSQELFAQTAGLRDELEESMLSLRDSNSQQRSLREEVGEYMEERRDALHQSMTLEAELEEAHRQYREELEQAHQECHEYEEAAAARGSCCFKPRVTKPRTPRKSPAEAKKPDEAGDGEPPPKAKSQCCAIA